MQSYVVPQKGVNSVDSGELVMNGILHGKKKSFKHEYPPPVLIQILSVAAGVCFHLKD